jgi:hypothetical protein
VHDHCRGPGYLHGRKVPQFILSIILKNRYLGHVVTLILRITLPSNGTKTSTSQQPRYFGYRALNKECRLR